MVSGETRTVRGGATGAARLRWALEVAVLAAAYFAAGRVGLELATIGDHVTLVWPPTGIAVAALVRRGRDRWPGVFVGALALEATVQATVPAAAVIAVGNTAGPLLAASLLARARFVPPLDRASTIVPFVGWVPVALVVPASVGVIALGVLAGVPTAELPTAWAFWWLGDTVGALAIAPLLMGLDRASVVALAARWRDVVLMVVMMAAVGAVVFFGDRLPMAFLVLLPLIWTAVRLPGLGASLTANLVAAVAVAGTVAGHGPFALVDQVRGLIALALFNLSVAGVPLLIGALIGETHRAQAESAHRLALLGQITQVQRDFIAAGEPRAAAGRLLDAMLAVTRSEFGFIAEVHHDDAGAPFLRMLAMSDIAWDDASRALAAKDGVEFRNMGTLFGAGVLAAAPVLSNAPASDPRAGGLPPGHPPLAAFLGLPLMTGDEQVGFVGLANRPDGYTDAIRAEMEPVLTTCAALVGALRAERRRRDAERARADLEAQLRQAQKLEAIGTLAGGIAHDFNNILAAIIGNASLLRDDLAADHPGRESLGYIEQASGRARDIVRQMLAFGRPNAGGRAAVDLGGALGEVTLLLAAALPASAKIARVVDPACPPIIANAAQVHQVIVNLMTNAVQALPDGVGTVTVTVAPAAPDEGPPREPGEGCVCLSVRDDGVGMAAATVERIFEPFFTTKAVGEGSGLGLAVVHGIVTSHGGTITVDSAPGQGTTFRTYWPCATAAADAASGPAGAALAPAPGCRIVVVDDEPMVLRVARRLLESAGCQVTTFVRAAEALRYLGESGTRCDVVVTDLTMPELTGLALATQLATLRPTLPVVIMTGFGDAASLAAAPPTVRGVVTKPFSGDELRAAVARAHA